MQLFIATFINRPIAQNVEVLFKETCFRTISV